MKIAVIPARGGSKRIPRKNIKPFAGKPMIAWSIETAKASGLFDHIIVSTDDAEIAEVAKHWGAEVPFVRPADLSNDQAGTTEVIAHATRWALDQGWPVTAVCCIYATAPFIQVDDLKQGWDELNSGDWDYSFTVTDFASPIFRSFKQTAEGGIEMFFPEHFNTRSQDLPATLYDAGQFYWGRPRAWLEGKRIFDRHSKPLAIPRWRVQDIDTQDDWVRAEILAPIIIGVKGSGWPCITSVPPVELVASTHICCTSAPGEQVVHGTHPGRSSGNAHVGVRRLALGTAQFGQPYGIANKTGQVTRPEVKVMLQLAAANNIDMLDTAIDYGESETCLGYMDIQGFKLITKLPAVPEGCADITGWIKEQVAASLTRLGVTAVYGLLLHRSEQLLGMNGKYLYQALQDLKDSGQVQKVGVSIYAPSELEPISKLFHLDLVQAPFSLVDRRLETTGWLQQLKDDGVELHTRSAFLQGLLLMPQAAIPPNSRHGMTYGKDGTNGFQTTMYRLSRLVWGSRLPSQRSIVSS